jgi:hypothetical protein
VRHGIYRRTALGAVLAYRDEGEHQDADREHRAQVVDRRGTGTAAAAHGPTTAPT